MEFKTPASVPLPADCGTQPADDEKAVCALMRFDELLADPAVADGGIAPSALNGSNSSSHDDTSASQRSNGSGAPTLPVEPSKKKKRLPVTAADLQSALAGRNGAEEVLCPGGFSVNVYSGNFLEHYAIASEHVVVTRGLVKYVDHHARYGAQTRFRFQLCHNYLLRKCPKLSECSYIHATQLPAPTQVHLNPFAPRRDAPPDTRVPHGSRRPDSMQDSPAVADRYASHPPGLFFPVFPPLPPPRRGVDFGTGADACRVSSTAAVTVVGSQELIVTRGSSALVDAAARLPPALHANLLTLEGASQSVTLMPPEFVSRARHCAHFQFKRVCNLGADCQFIHSKAPLLSADRLAGRNDFAPSMPPAYQPGAAATCAPPSVPMAPAGGQPCNTPHHHGPAPASPHPALTVRRDTLAHQGTQPSLGPAIALPRSVYLPSHHAPGAQHVDPYGTHAPGRAPLYLPSSPAGSRAPTALRRGKQ